MPTPSTCITSSTTTLKPADCLGLSRSIVASVVVDARPKFIPTNTDAFAIWFGDSDAVDDQGQPLIVYHGGQEDFGLPGNTVIRGQKNGYRPFFVTPCTSLAQSYARDGNVTALYLKARSLDLTYDSVHIAPLLEIYRIRGRHLIRGVLAELRQVGERQQWGLLARQQRCPVQFAR